MKIINHHFNYMAALIFGGIIIAGIRYGRRTRQFKELADQQALNLSCLGEDTKLNLQQTDFILQMK